MMRALFALCVPIACAACVPAQTAPVPAVISLATNGALTCSATRMCAVGDCAPSGIVFDLIPDGAGLGVVLNDITTAVVLKETTSASTPDGPVTLTTYLGDDLRLTLARDGRTAPLAQLELLNGQLTQDISATCEAT